MQQVVNSSLAKGVVGDSTVGVLWKRTIAIPSSYKKRKRKREWYWRRTFTVPNPQKDL